MSVWTLRAAAVGLLVSMLLLIGCSADTGTSSSGVGGGVTYGGGSSGGGSGSGVPAGSGTLPMLVDVDANRTMTAAPGEGVGVFTEYATGGHWHVWWTCDTNVTAASCNFDLTASVTSGSLANVASALLEGGDQLVQANAAEVEVLTTTSTDVDGVRFDTSPGAVVTLEAKMNGQADGRILFFVQDGVVNGGYKGMLTDPLMFEPSTP
jgi:hypothetical protein